MMSTVGPKNLPIFTVNQLKPTRDEESLFTEEKIGMELRTLYIKAYLKEWDMP